MHLEWAPVDTNPGGCLDEQHPGGTRITLRRDGPTALWSITCVIPGLFVHTAYTGSEAEGRRKVADMKRDLVSILADGDSTPCYEKIRLFADSY